MTTESTNRLLWDDATKEACAAMMQEVEGFTTPISRVIEHDYGELEGSGSYIQIQGKRFLITNEHVASRLKTHSLAHQFCGCSNVYRTRNPFPVISYPSDVAICEIDDAIWTHASHKGRAIPIERFATSHSPVDGELLFVAGYAGDRSRFLFGELHSERLEYLTQTDQMPNGHGDPDFHFALYYRPDLAITTNPRSAGLPRPPGWSGTLVWNTRFAEMTKNGKEWSPSDAQVTGMVWGWPSSDACLLATKVEHFALPELLKMAELNGKHQSK